jgi:hypothetical protein
MKKEDEADAESILDRSIDLEKSFDGGNGWIEDDDNLPEEPLVESDCTDDNNLVGIYSLGSLGFVLTVNLSGRALVATGRRR